MKVRQCMTLLGATFLAVAAAGCFNPFSPRVGSASAVAVPAPQATSPQQLIRRFQWCWNNRGAVEYEDLFTDDFIFAFSAKDSANNAPITRDDEVRIGRNLFLDGSASEPRADRISLDFLTPILPLPDSRPGKIDPWHKEITTRVLLKLDHNGQHDQALGNVTFFVVRGDSALIPKVLKQRGIQNSPSRWFIERWEDRTGEASVVASPGPPPEAVRTGAPTGIPIFSVAGAPGRGTVATDTYLTWGELMLMYR